MSQSRTPDLLPVLSRGKHRSPRKGACFMELASYLAGERWSDHPRCTHPLLAALARDVNDYVADSHRSRLAPLIPEVIGLTSDDPRVDAWIALEAASTALPIVSSAKQGVAAIGILSCERQLNLLEGRDEWEVSSASREVLNQAPQARDWAMRFPAAARGGAPSFRRRSAPVIVHSAVSGIAAACAPAVDDTLVDLLERVIAGCRERFEPETATPTVHTWDEAVALTR